MFMLIRRSRDASSVFDVMGYDVRSLLIHFLREVRLSVLNSKWDIHRWFFFITVHILWNSSRKSEIHPLHLRPLLAHPPPSPATRITAAEMWPLPFLADLKSSIYIAQIKNNKKIKIIRISQVFVCLKAAIFASGRVQQHWTRTWH